MPRLIPSPLVSSDDLVRLVSPFIKPFEFKTRFRSFNGKLSPGLTFIGQRRGGRLHGQFHVYCSLNVDSVRLLRDGHVQLAHQVSERAAELEGTETFHEIVDFLNRSVLPDVGSTDEALRTGLATAAIDGRLAELLERANADIAGYRAELPLLESVLTRFLTVTDVTDDVAVLGGEHGERIEIARNWLAPLHLDREQTSVVMSTELAEGGGALLVSFTPAIAVKDDQSLRRLPPRDPFAPEQAEVNWPIDLFQAAMAGGSVRTSVGHLPKLTWRKRD